MTHSPPVPPGNQSPFPIMEPPNVHQPALYEPVKPRRAPSGDIVPRALVAGAAVAGVAAVAAVATALVRSKRKKAASPATTRAARKSATRATTAKPKASPTAKSPTAGTVPKRRSSGDDPSKRGPQDSSRVAMGEEHEVRYWTERFGVDRETLQRAVDQVGNGVAAIEAELRKS